MYMQTRSIATLPYDVCQLAIRDALPSSPRPDRKHHTGTSRRTSLFHLHPLDVRWCCLWWRWKRGRSYASNRQLIGRKQLQTTDMHGAPFPRPPGAHAHEHTHAHVRHTSLKHCSILYVPGVHGNITRFYWVWVGVNTGEAAGCKNGRCGVANGWRLYPFFTRHERGPLLPPFLPVTHGPRFYPNPYGRYR
jgi:hypothetical protein